MQITTIKLQKKTKSALDRIKEENQSYDAVVEGLISQAGMMNLHEKLVEGYKQGAKQSLEVLETWEHTSKEVDEQW